MVATIKPYDVDPGISTSGVEGTPAPQVGDAVHYEPSDGLYYRGNSLTRNNIIGIKDGDSNIIRLGSCGGLSSLTANSIYYLKTPSMNSLEICGGTSDKSCGVRQSTTNYAQSQSFRLDSKSAIAYIVLYLRRINAPAFNLYIEIRSDDGSGKPSTTVLARSEAISCGDFKTSEDCDVFFRMIEYYEFQPSTTYHICLQADTEAVDAIQYVVWRGMDSGAYADGQRCYSNNTGAWTADSTDDLIFGLYGYVTSETSGNNISTEHPFENTNADIVSYLPIIEIGRAKTTTEIVVSIEKNKPVVLFDDWEYEATNTGTTETLVFPSHVLTGAPGVFLIGGGGGRLLVVFKMKTSNYSYQASAKVWLNGKASSAFTSFDIWYNRRSNSKGYLSTLILSGRFRLGFLLGNAGAYTTSVSRITVLAA